MDVPQEGHYGASEFFDGMDELAIHEISQAPQHSSKLPVADGHAVHSWFVVVFARLVLQSAFEPEFRSSGQSKITRQCE